jgi:hypothetical protein
MDAQHSRLQRKLEDLLQQASAVAAELQGLEQGSGTPHYDQIELPAHALGQKFSRMIQGERAREVVAASLADAACPTCGKKCRVETKKRRSTRWTGRWSCWKPWPNAAAAGGLFFPQRIALGLDARESTPGFKRQLVVLNAETRSLKRASIVLERIHQFQVSPNTIERICQEAGEDLAAAQENDWRGVLTGEVPVPELAIVENDGGRARTRRMDCGPGVHLEGKGWNETKNAILVSATSATSDVDPQPDPPACFLNQKHVAKLTETAKAKENAGENDDLPDRQAKAKKAKRRSRSRGPRTSPSASCAPCWPASRTRGTSARKWSERPGGGNSSKPAASLCVRRPGLQLDHARDALPRLHADSRLHPRGHLPVPRCPGLLREGRGLAHLCALDDQRLAGTSW